jgi:prevent-host-death family protein
MRYDAPMISSITERELRNDYGAILREVHAGETIIVSRSGVPVAALCPARYAPKCRELLEAAVRLPGQPQRSYRCRAAPLNNSSDRHEPDDLQGTRLPVLLL